MNNEIIGYIVAIKRKNAKSNESLVAYEVLAYGEEMEPSPDMLLRGRGASMFDSKEDAVKAIDETKEQGRSDNCEWVNKWEFGTLPILKRAK